MRLSELISFVRQIERRPDTEESETSNQPLSDEPNAPRCERLPVPPWVRDDGGRQRIPDRGDLVLDVEQEFSPTALPPDLQAPNPSIDILAYYLPFHLYDSDWGIYLRESGVLVAASIVKGSALAPGDRVFLERGRRLLLDHELMHFCAEAACSRAEVVSKYPLYRPYFHDGFAAAHEEALANASAFRGLHDEPPVIKDRVATWMRHQGPGYRDFERWVNSARFAAGCRCASQHMLKIFPGARSSRPEPAEFLFDSTRRFKPPIYVVLDVSLATALKPFPRAHGMRVLVHTRDHPPPHIHLDIPPGRPFTRCEWPSLQSLEGDTRLSSAGRRNLDAYIAEYGSKIDQKVRAVYPDVAPWTPMLSPVV
jgi:hypothetical protein